MRRAFLEARFGQFVFHGPAAPVGFPPFLGDFAGQVQAFGIGAEFFQVNDAVPILSAAIQARHGLFHIGCIVIPDCIAVFILQYVFILIYVIGIQIFLQISPEFVDHFFFCQKALTQISARRQLKDFLLQCIPFVSIAAGLQG